jgi:hypothetical protein
MTISMSMPDDNELHASFKAWWRNEGSKMRHEPGEDAEEHCKRVCQIAWDNGTYIAAYTIAKTLVDGF